jgi:hypothetical protein
MLCGLPVAPSVYPSEAVSAPKIEGLKVKVVVHFVPTLPVQAFEAIEKSAAFVPVIATLEKVTGPATTVTDTRLEGDVLPFFTLPKGSAVGANVNVAGDGATPVPLIATVCGLPVALSVNVRVAVRTASAVGVK